MSRRAGVPAPGVGESPLTIWAALVSGRKELRQKVLSVTSASVAARRATTLEQEVRVGC